MPIWHICPIGILVPNIHRNILTVFIILKIVIFDVGPYDPLVPCVYTVQLLSSCVHFHYLFFYTYGRCRLRQRNLFKNKIKLRFTYYFVYIRYWPAVLIEIVGFNCICFWFSSIYSFYILRGWSLGHWTKAEIAKGMAHVFACSGEEEAEVLQREGGRTVEKKSEGSRPGHDLVAVAVEKIAFRRHDHVQVKLIAFSYN